MVDKMKPKTESNSPVTPHDYGRFLDSLKAQVRAAQAQARRSVNTHSSVCTGPSAIKSSPGKIRMVGAAE